ncbi:MAG TPA: DMT family transporter [Rudaea sp.]
MIAGACAIAFAPILVRLADTGPVASAFWRCALAVPLLWAWALAGRATGDPSRMSLRALAGAGAFFAADLGLWHFAVLFTSVANATLLGNISPIFVTLAGWLLWRQKVTSTYLVGMAAAIGGMLVLAGPNFGLHGTRVLGDALAALTGVFYAGYMLSIKAARDAGASAARSTATSTTVTALVLLPVALLQPHVFWPVSASGWLTVIGLAVVAQVLGQGLIAYAFAHLPAPLCSVILLVQPVLAAVLAWMLFGEAIAPAQFFGGAIVLVGAWLSKKGS